MGGKCLIVDRISGCKERICGSVFKLDASSTPELTFNCLSSVHITMNVTRKLTLEEVSFYTLRPAIFAEGRVGVLEKEIAPAGAISGIAPCEMVRQLISQNWFAHTVVTLFRSHSRDR
jgi:hypothetical protein